MAHVLTARSPIIRDIDLALGHDVFKDGRSDLHEGLDVGLRDPKLAPLVLEIVLNILILVIELLDVSFEVAYVKLELLNFLFSFLYLGSRIFKFSL